MVVYHFVDSDLKDEIFSDKEGATEWGGTDFEIAHQGTCCTPVLGVEEISCRACQLFCCFLVAKNNTF